MADLLERESALLPGQRLARGLMRGLRAMGYSVVPEVTLPNGRRADVFAVNAKAEFLLVEVKASVADFRSDKKWPDYLGFCDRFAFAVDGDFPIALLPEEAGVFRADPYAAHLWREPPLHPLPAARRKAMLLRFGQLAANRLRLHEDPEGEALPPGGQGF